MLITKKYNPSQVEKELPRFYKPYLISAICVYDKESLLGHIALYMNPHIGKETLLLGGYHAVDNIQVSRTLFTEVLAEAKRLGFSTVLGPMNGSTWEQYRFVSKSDRHSFLMEPQQEDHFIAQWKDAGFTMCQQYYSSIAPVNQISFPVDRVDLISKRFSQLDVRIEKWGSNLNSEQWKQLTHFNNAAFAKSDFFSPISVKGFTNKYCDLLKQIDTNYMYFATQKSELVGILFAYPDAKDKTEQTLVLKTLAHIPSKIYKGLGTWLVLKLLTDAKANNYTHIIHALMKQDNASLERSKQFGGQVFRNYGLYKLEL